MTHCHGMVCFTYIKNNTMTSKQTTIERVSGRELPKAWAQRAQVQPDDMVQITITPDRNESGKNLKMIMDEAAAQAKRNGLTEEKLNQILNEIDEERSY